jgi:phytoene dehydrogenase-like protein
VTINKNPVLADDELQLDRYGYEQIHPEVVLHYPFVDGASLTVFKDDPDRTAETIAQVSKQDAATFKRLAATRPAELNSKTLAAMTGFAVSTQVWQSRYMQAAALSGGKFAGPNGAELGTGLQAFSMLTHMAGRPIPKGGSGMLTVAIGRVIEAHHGTILTSMPVTGIIIEKGQCKGVSCADGREFRAALGVVSTMHVKHVLAMTPRELWPEPIAEDVDLMQPEMAMFQFHYALTEPVHYKLAKGGTIDSAEASIMEDPTSVFLLGTDNARGELHIDDYPLQVTHPSVFDTERVPSGRGLVKIEGTMPYSLKQGPAHWDEIKEEVAAVVISRYMAHTSNITEDKIMAKMLFSPLDIERKNASMWRGSVHGFDSRLSSFAPYRLPIPGLYQTGDCTAPGGGISGFPGRNVAELILREQGRDIRQVVTASNQS